MLTWSGRDSTTILLSNLYLKRLSIFLDYPIGRPLLQSLVESNKYADVLTNKGYQASFSVTYAENVFPLLGILFNDDIGGACPPNIRS